LFSEPEPKPGKLQISLLSTSETATLITVSLLKINPVQAKFGALKPHLQETQVMPNSNLSHLMPEKLDSTLNPASPIEPDYLCVCRYTSTEWALEAAYNEGHTTGEIAASQTIYGEIQSLVDDREHNVDTLYRQLQDILTTIEQRYPW